MFGGYTGKLLFVDLTNKKTRVEELDYEMARKFLGGYSLASRILYENKKHE